LRAESAWRCVSNGVPKDYVNVAKALPALIMNSGLLQVLAFLHAKEEVHRQVARSLRTWLWSRVKGGGSNSADPGFEPFMDHLIKATPAEFQAVTAEAFAWLKWLRQFAAANETEA
jgi:CRISPR-associated protein Cmr5